MHDDHDHPQKPHNISLFIRYVSHNIRWRKWNILHVLIIKDEIVHAFYTCLPFQMVTSANNARWFDEIYVEEIVHYREGVFP